MQKKPSVRKPTAKRKQSAIKPSRRGRILDFVTIVERYKSAIVGIEVTQESPRTKSTLLPYGFPWDTLPSQEPQALNIGTGFVFDPRGYILTNEHVIHGATKVMVQMLGKQKPIAARVVGTNYEHDLAVLKVTLPKNISVLRLGHSKDVKVGEWVLAVGNPLGLDHSVTVGIVSAKERPMQIGDRSYPHLLQTDAAINRGNSGGPLINMRGEVIGINTAVSQSSQGIGFAIAIDVVRDALKAMMGNAYHEGGL
ncbi:S1C family serine protease [Sulfoacidibacillus thermotolerans]|uniref:Peptidase A2 n=1 Tax=Sulfoacidibacillus thermotolerans TaxID=1765684 RepID=A0A2U3DCS5_SULT2|nr:trypsin-like peptidase domain-containing protein [Sulfoacidibacillus thermotolerans]PWI59045.1 peptidase A2 [Sulfoacidibacillus thermotolerans]